MGIFDFVKDVGSSIFGDDEEAKAEVEAAAAKAASDAASEEEARQLAEAAKNQIIAEHLAAFVTNLGLKIDMLEVAFADETATVAGKTRSQSEREKVVLAIGNSQGVARVIDDIDVEPVFHVVQKGDTLSKIAESVYGDPMKYEVIFEANRPMLTHPDKIYPGQSLRIPDA